MVTQHSEHIRCRGIPASYTKYKTSQDNITALDIHKIIFKGEVIVFDLINDLTTLVCNRNRDHTVSNVTKLTRTTGFVRDGNDKIFIG